MEEKKAAEELDLRKSEVERGMKRAEREQTVELLNSGAKLDVEFINTPEAIEFVKKLLEDLREHFEVYKSVELDIEESQEGKIKIITKNEIHVRLIDPDGDVIISVRMNEDMFLKCFKLQ